MRVARVHTFHLDNVKERPKSEEIEVDIKPILYLEDLGIFDDEKEFYRFIIRTKYYIRNSYEYSTYIKFLKKYCGLNRCGVHPNIKMEDGFQIHAHHTPLVMEDIVHIIIAKRQKRNESLTMAAIAKEVMELHYLDLFGLYPLCETCHEYAHGDTNDLFIPLDAIFGDPKAFFEIYSDFISSAMKLKFKNILELNEGYTLIRKEIPDALVKKYVYVQVKGQEMVSTKALSSFINRVMEDL